MNFSFRGTCRRSVDFLRWFVFPIGVLNGSLHLRHVYGRRCSFPLNSSCTSAFFWYSSMSSESCRTFSLLSSSSSGIAERAATSFVISVRSDVLVYSTSFHWPSRRCVAFSVMALVLVLHCACSFCLGLSISLHCFGCIVLVSWFA